MNWPQPRTTSWPGASGARLRRSARVFAIVPTQPRRRTVVGGCRRRPAGGGHRRRWSGGSESDVPFSPGQRWAPRIWLFARLPKVPRVGFATCCGSTRTTCRSECCQWRRAWPTRSGSHAFSSGCRSCSPRRRRCSLEIARRRRGVAAYRVHQRQREFAVRVAVGATPGQLADLRRLMPSPVSEYRWQSRWRCHLTSRRANVLQLTVPADSVASYRRASPLSCCWW